MSIPLLESLLSESNDERRRTRLLDIVQPHVRDKIAPILSDVKTTTKITQNKHNGITHIIYENVLWKVILTQDSIDRIDEFGTTWNVASSKNT